MRWLNLWWKTEQNNPMFPVVRATLSGISENEVEPFIMRQNDGESTVFKLGKIDVAKSQLEKEIDKLISLIEAD